MNILVKRALDFAAVCHKNQKRKYPGVEVPYVSHVAGVALILARHGFDDEVVAAGALHDVIEDCGVTEQALADLFGERVAALVRSTSEADKSLEWEERKRLYLEHFKNESWSAQAVSIADKIDNFSSILVCAREYGDPWAMFKRGRDVQMSSFEAFARVVESLPPHPLCDEFSAALAAVQCQR
jgi:(p)ppGpp synthase/HD superfamily hydrolase